MIAAMLSLHCSYAVAGLSEECNADLMKNLDTPSAKRLSDAQRDEIKHAGEAICLEKSLTQIHKQGLVTAQKFIDTNIALNLRYCGPSPDSSRAAQCAQADSQVSAQRQSLSNDKQKVETEERRISRMEADYQRLLSAKPLPNRKIDAKVAAKATTKANIAKVKAAILEAMKDPESAQFRRITASSDGSLICGEVNAKNEFGGYAGYKKFANIADGDHDFTFFDANSSPTLAETCSKQPGS